MRTKFSVVPPGIDSTLPVATSQSRTLPDDVVSRVFPWGEKATVRKILTRPVGIAGKCPVGRAKCDADQRREDCDRER